MKLTDIETKVEINDSISIVPNDGRQYYEINGIKNSSELVFDMGIDMGMEWDLENDIPPKNRVAPNEDILGSIKRIPFLKRFMWDEDTERNSHDCPCFDPSKINEYMGLNWTKGKELTSDNMNVILLEAELRGEL